MTSNTIPDENISEFSPRSYQTEIMEQAKSKNLIVCLPTGSGKTYIAVMLIKELSPVIRRNLDDGGKRTILIVKTKELARQHCKTLNDHLDLKIKSYSGSSKINLSDNNRWKIEFETNQILIFIAQIFLNLLSHNLFSLDKVNLLIFDECHHAIGDDPYALIMKKHYNSCLHHPRILGLTASISGQKIEPKQLQKAAKELEEILHARIETGSNRMEITENSTSVDVEHKMCANYEKNICRKKETIRKIFQKIKLLLDELNKYLNTKKSQVIFQNDLLQENNQPNFIQLQCRTLDQLKCHLDNIIHIGYDLGLYGLFLGIISLKNYLESKNALINITDKEAKDLYEKIIKSLDSLINNEFKNLPENRQILYSDKVIRLEEIIKKNSLGQCIVFVERVYAAAFLYQVLGKIFGDSIKIKYLAGSKAYIDGISVSNKYQREVVEEFRQKHINVLISTAIIEEGLDIPGCNLVIRFNKPNNFSSYMQSKGRARSRKENALFVLFRDEPEFEEFRLNKEEYENYEYMEKLLKQNFKVDYDSDSSSNDDHNTLRPYRTENGVKIDGIRSIQIINQYCAVLGNSEILSPRFCFYTNENNRFKCILSMPTNCPIREDIICENSNKRLAKQECCLKMVEMLHKKGELDQRCLPIRPAQCLTTDDDNDDDETEKVPFEIIEKQSSYFFHDYNSLSTCWHLYRINISNNNDLGFIVPNELIKLPKFNLYGRNDVLTVKITYLKPIDLKPYKNQLEFFCRYIFEEVFDDMNTGLESILKFDIEHSTFKLFPCLLNKSDDIDYQRMMTICDRKNKFIQNLSELNDNELYYPSYPSKKQLYTNIPDVSLLKRVTDKWEYKKRLETIESYADYYEHKVPNIHIQRDLSMATMKSFRKPRINYLKDSPLKKEKETNSLIITQYSYYPIEVLHYGPLNQTDFELFFKLPSILVRISQLYYIEQLRKLLADKIRSYSLFDNEHMSIVTFDDCLTNIFSSIPSNVLSLVSFNYNFSLKNINELQPSSNLIFQSITRRSANENTDMENLEILGDCFLKLAISMSFYHQYPFDNVGKLTLKKDKQVSNENLYQLAKKQELINYLYVDKLIYEGKEANWIPPGYKIDEEISQKYTKQKAKRKAFADMIEALIGAFLISTNYITTMKFMKWLGLDVIPINSEKPPSILRADLSDTIDNVNSKIQEFFSNFAFDDIEKKINYVFKNKAYLIAAFTHPSYYNNRLTQCYERLEYLGDAILDFLVIRCIFVEYYKQVTPSRVTDIRQDLSNNGRLAYILVSCDLHKKILHQSPYLFTRITSYLENQTLFSQEQSMKDKLNKDIDQWADSTAPKALADVFEALIGAIFLDSGYCLETVWKIIEPLLRQYIDRSIQHRNLNPVRSFFEQGGKIIKESCDEKREFTCMVELSNGTKFDGYGKNKKLAKYDACQKAINYY
ncbi:unnamed protein product [Rotaria sordida]|uniref:Uncharacterized protein n=1 Tax=Rotaria sordida TaxID=392033 RepID=A0A818MP61_9BILA|nr:unnamed protein product [Rotaria sordida]CAF3592584.1 unnamed protein product [Rotaria sordida]